MLIKVWQIERVTPPSRNELPQVLQIDVKPKIMKKKTMIETGRH